MRKTAQESRARVPSLTYSSLAIPIQETGPGEMFLFRLRSASQSDTPSRDLAAFPFPFASFRGSGDGSTAAREGG